MEITLKNSNFRKNFNYKFKNLEKMSFCIFYHFSSTQNFMIYLFLQMFLHSYFFCLIRNSNIFWKNLVFDQIFYKKVPRNWTNYGILPFQTKKNTKSPKKYFFVFSKNRKWDIFGPIFYN